MNAVVYFCGAAAAALVVAGVLAADALLYLRDQPTVSEWLRDNPEWFLGPSALIVVGLAALAVHLWP